MQGTGTFFRPFLLLLTIFGMKPSRDDCPILLLGALRFKGAKSPALVVDPDPQAPVRACPTRGTALLPKHHLPPLYLLRRLPSYGTFSPQSSPSPPAHSHHLQQTCFSRTTHAGALCRALLPFPRSLQDLFSGESLDTPLVGGWSQQWVGVLLVLSTWGGRWGIQSLQES